MSDEVAALADLVAACLAAGCGPVEAVEAAAVARRGAGGDRLLEAVAAIRAGSDPVAAWRSLEEPPELAALGRALARATESGTATAGAVVAVARTQRLAGRLAAEAALARLGVLAAAPLGLCFLPAFVCLGVVPVVLDLGARLLAT
jgi:pilus assembly protein TadC